ncbi:uncharacterized protein LOC117114595 [Anneissia japonica]|uniref:uncharacterized protein LOC117114595 n=1 Tax=Anneissia japonica TaxID=1529436 RepID=UPI0014256B11|nr:uncharacterized protein LOC117114595 [Anneissia japonica]
MKQKSRQRLYAAPQKHRRHKEKEEKKKRGTRAAKISQACVNQYVNIEGNVRNEIINQLGKVRDSVHRKVLHHILSTRKLRNCATSLIARATNVNRHTIRRAQVCSIRKIRKDNLPLSIKQQIQIFYKREDIYKQMMLLAFRGHMKSIDGGKMRNEPVDEAVSRMRKTSEEVGGPRGIDVMREWFSTMQEKIEVEDVAFRHDVLQSYFLVCSIINVFFFFLGLTYHFFTNDFDIEAAATTLLQLQEGTEAEDDNTKPWLIVSEPTATDEDHHAAFDTKEYRRQVKIIESFPESWNEGMNAYVAETLNQIDAIQESIKSATESSNRVDALDKKLRENGLMFTTPATPGDGNCLFHALAYRANVFLKWSGITHLELRHAIAEFLSMHKEHWQEKVKQDLIDMGVNWTTCIANIRTSGVWGDQIVLAVAAWKLQCKIKLISSTLTLEICPPVKGTCQLYIWGI